MGRTSRARACLWGVALGDAMGMPVQDLPGARVETMLGRAAVLLPGPPDQPYCPGLPAGQITDDTEQTLLVARLLIEDGHLDAHRLADRLLTWEDQARRRGLLDLLGPSTRRALTAVRAGADPSSTGGTGTTNGAAMRVSPVGIATPTHPVDGLLAAVADSCRATHATPVALAGAAAVAAAISAGVQGSSTPTALQFGADVAATVHPGLGDTLRQALRVGSGHPGGAVVVRVRERFGTGVEIIESVPAAFAVAAASVPAPRHPALTAAWLGARLGGDADTIASIAAGMVAASVGDAALPTSELALLRRVNPVLGEIPGLVAGLLRRRRMA